MAVTVSERGSSNSNLDRVLTRMDRMACGPQATERPHVVQDRNKCFDPVDRCGWREGWSEGLIDRLPGRSARTGRRWRAARRGRARRAWCRGTPPAGWRGRGGAARRAPCAAATRPTWTWCAAPSWTCCAPCAPSATARGGPAAPRAARRPPTRTSSCSGSTRADDPSPFPCESAAALCGVVEAWVEWSHWAACGRPIYVQVQPSLRARSLCGSGRMNELLLELIGNHGYQINQALI